MAKILWIVSGLIGLGSWGAILVILFIGIGGGSICWPWQNCQAHDCIYTNLVARGEGNISGDRQTSSKPDTQTIDAQSRAVQTGIFAGAVLIRAYRNDERSVARLTKGLELAKESGIPDNVKRMEQALEDGRKRKDITFEIYVDQLKKSAEYSMQQNSEQLDALKNQLGQNSDFKPLERFAEIFVMQIGAYKKDHVIDEKELGSQILDPQPLSVRD